MSRNNTGLMESLDSLLDFVNIHLFNIKQDMVLPSSLAGDAYEIKYYAKKVLCNFKISYKCKSDY